MLFMKICVNYKTSKYLFIYLFFVVSASDFGRAVPYVEQYPGTVVALSVPIQILSLLKLANEGF